jgi:hypothetical protein
MNFYQKRRIEFRQIVGANTWQIKVYTISYKDKFESVEVLENAIANLPNWLETTKSPNFETYKIAFLIVHEGRDGVWNILSWWTGENMLRSVTFCTSAAMPKEFVMTPQTGGMVCVWELEIVEFERQMWIEHILKKADKPDFTGYLEQKIDGYF